MKPRSLFDKIINIDYVKKHFEKWKIKKEEIPVVTFCGITTIFIHNKNILSYKQDTCKVYKVEYSLSPNKNHAYLITSKNSLIYINYYLLVNYNQIAIEIA